ncbi:DUF2334 domain-containing protein [Pseudodesulfovibrio sp. zrk46]|uniref:DUF2334 domain-containing protein n=1 Tax=Pseudodesulfovibrio sp. zrk46 TaxID=2725288 RepID=UPI0014495136|nr:DUF2334 domain-containing protein [Pseudodesulfovibrio sp. zrk46]QJB55655.1 polysaccharide deacetylase family protein [Pseudodesulfovibrio sp. zrk46]
MIVKSTISPCWLASEQELTAAATRMADILSGAPSGTEIFFRADDIAVPGNNCQRMMEIHIARQIPLHMAVTPAWLTESRWAILKEWAGDSGMFIWHQHGWRHVNHQQSGKKGEFGTDRPKSAKKADLAKGMERLRTFMGDEFQPVFTPPWNRFDAATAEALQELGYRAVSRSTGEQKKVPLTDFLPDIPINVDLHTRSEADPAEGLNALIDEFAQAVKSGRVGVMLHHQRMNDAAFVFLDAVLVAAKGLALRSI